jgi:hypothetical protein
VRAMVAGTSDTPILSIGPLTMRGIPTTIFPSFLAPAMDMVFAVGILPSMASEVHFTEVDTDIRAILDDSEVLAARIAEVVLAAAEAVVLAAVAVVVLAAAEAVVLAAVAVVVLVAVAVVVLVEVAVLAEVVVLVEVAVLAEVVVLVEVAVLAVVVEWTKKRKKNKIQIQFYTVSPIFEALASRAPYNRVFISTPCGTRQNRIHRWDRLVCTQLPPFPF